MYYYTFQLLVTLIFASVKANSARCISKKLFKVVSARQQFSKLNCPVKAINSGISLKRFMVENELQSTFYASDGHDHWACTCWNWVGSGNVIPSNFDLYGQITSEIHPDADLYLPMDTSTGITVNGPTINGEMSGGAALVPGRVGNAIKIDNSGSRLVYDKTGPIKDTCIGNTTLEKCLGGYTVSFWMKVESPLAMNQITEFRAVQNAVLTEHGGPPFYVLLWDGYVRVLLLNNDDTKFDYAIDPVLCNLTTGDWFHVSATTDGVTGTTYLNGCPLGQMTKSSTSVTNFEKIEFGFVAGNGDNTQVLFDEILVWNAPKTNDFIHEVYYEYFA